MKLDIFGRRKNKPWGSICPDEPRYLALAQNLDNSPPSIGASSRTGAAASVHDPSCTGEPSSVGEDLLQQTGGTVDEATDARQERVDRLHREVRSGTYDIPFAQLVRILADLILRRR